MVYLAEQDEAGEAFQVLGDRAVPFLLSEVILPPQTALSKAYAKLRETLPRQLRQRLPQPSTDNKRNSAASDLLAFIRPSSRALMPRLKSWLSSPDHPRYLLALSLLGTIGEGAAECVPHLIEALQSANADHRVLAMQALEDLGTNARPAMPALVAALDDPTTRLRAISALGNLGLEARVAIPQLESSLTSTNRHEALVAAAALHKINTGSNGLPMLIAATGDPLLRSTAIRQLGRLGPAAAPAIDTLIDALKTEDRREPYGSPEWIRVADALHKISPTNRTAIAIIREKLRDAEGLDRLNAASRLLMFDPGEQHGIELLAEIVRSDPVAHSRLFAASVLRKGGPPARATVPALKAALTDKDPAVRRAAASALRKIEPASAE